MEDYRSKVYNALKGELGDSFDKSADEFTALIKKKEEPVSIGDSQSLDIPVVSTQEEVATPSATLSFQEQQKKAPDFMGLISEGYKEQPSGVIKTVSEGLSKAERPVEDKFASYVD